MKPIAVNAPSQSPRLARGLNGILSALLLCFFAFEVRGQVWQFEFNTGGQLATQTTEFVGQPDILRHPASAIVAPGKTASFSVVARNTRAMTYQWQFNGGAIAGATSDTLLLNNVNIADEGLYSVVLSNPLGSANSTSARLWIDVDDDGLGDSWERMYFGGLNGTPSRDSDRDGVSDVDEFRDSTNPTNSASALFRLTVLSNGGRVIASPSKPSYTNGEAVTLTAIPYPPELFHGWTGGVTSTTNRLDLIIRSNQTVFAHFQSMTLTWTNPASGDWHNPRNWSPNLVPLSVDDVYIQSQVTVTITQAVACRNLVLTTGSIDGPGDLTITGQAQWTFGNITGSGRVTIAPGASLNLANSPYNVTLGRTLENAGTVLFTGAAAVYLNNVTITNRPGALFEVQNAQALANGGGSPRIDNAGTFRKSSNSGTTTLGVPFNNYGALDIRVGTLLNNAPFLNSGVVAVTAGASQNITGGGSGAGTFEAWPGGSVRWVGGTYTLSPGAQMLGGGVYQISGSTLVCNASTSVELLEMISGALDGSGTLTVSNKFNWNLGNMGGTGRTIIAPGAVFNVNNTPYNVTLGRTLENAGSASWSGAAALYLNNALITNRPGAVFEVKNAQALANGGGASRFDNAGVFRKSSNSGITSIGFTFNNYGKVETVVGTLSLSGGGSHAGQFETPLAATLNFSGGTHAALPTSVISGAGNLHVSGNGALTAAGLVNMTGENTFSGGNATFSGNYICTNILTVSGCYLNLTGTETVAPAKLNLNGGTLDGSIPVTVREQMKWTLGNMLGSGRTIIAPGANLDLNNSPYNVTLGRTLENAGTASFTGAAAVYLNNAVITNRPGALFDVQNAQSLANGGGSPRIDNAGTFRKSSNSGTTALGIPFNNYGTLDIRIGTLLNSSPFLNSGAVAVSAGASQNISGGGSGAGTFEASSGGSIRWVGGTFTLSPGAQLLGGGVYQINASTLICNASTSVELLDMISGALDGSGTLTVSNTFNWIMGNMGGTGRTIIAPGAVLNLNNTPYNVVLGRTLENAGTASWSGTAAVYLNNALITNRPGAVFEFKNAQALANGGGAPRFDNAGTLRKAINSGTTTLGVPLVNYGNLELLTGLLSIGADFTSQSYASIDFLIGGTNARSSYGQIQKQANWVANGRVSLKFTNSFIPALGDSFTLVTSTTRSGTFTSFVYPTNLLTMQLSNTPNAVLAIVTGYNTNGGPIFATDLPAAETFYAGRPILLTTLAMASTPVAYQWTKNGTNLFDSGTVHGAQTSVLSISNAASKDAGVYQVSASNSAGIALSTSSRVDIQSVPKLNAAGAGWSLQGTTLPAMSSNTATLTSGLGSTARSVFYKAPLYIRAFSASFVYRDVQGGGADGITFSLQNDIRGAAALGGGGSGLGYSGINPSVAFAMNIYAPYTPGIALRTNGTLPSAYAAPGKVNIASGNPVHVALLYTNSVLKVTLVESNTPNIFATNFFIDLPAMLGAETAFVGFTGSEGAVASTQVLSDFRFIPLTPITLNRSQPGALVLSWPATIGGYTLQSTSDLTNPSSWTDVAEPILQVGAENRVLINATPTNLNRNYRLSISLHP